MIAVGSLFGGIVVDYYNESTLIYSVLSFIILALIALFTLTRGLNNPKMSCES